MLKFTKKEEIAPEEIIEVEETTEKEEVVPEKKGFHIPKTLLIAGSVGVGLLAMFGISKMRGASDMESFDLDDADSDEESSESDESEETSDPEATSEE